MRKLVIAGAALASIAVSAGVAARQSSGLTPPVALASLPAEAQSTHRLILQGGPFPYSKDGVVFGNRERILPAERRGYYREYTVRTPGAGNRGARRIVCGGTTATAPETCFYTQDHYNSFQRIVP